MAGVIRCEVPRGTERSAFVPFMGDEKAIAEGCTCPYQVEWPKSVLFSEDCPVHILTLVTH